MTCWSQDGFFDACGAPVDDLGVPPVVILLGFLGAFRSVQKMVVVGLARLKTWERVPKRKRRLRRRLVNLHLGWVVLLPEVDIMVLWQVLVEKNLFDEQRNGLFYALFDAIVQKRHIILDGTDILHGSLLGSLLKSVLGSLLGSLLTRLLASEDMLDLVAIELVLSPRRKLAEERLVFIDEFDVKDLSNDFDRSEFPFEQTFQSNAITSFENMEIYCSVGSLVSGVQFPYPTPPESDFDT